MRRCGFHEKLFLLIYLALVLVGCAGLEPGHDEYTEWLSTCKSYQDVADWFIAANWKYDNDRLKARLSRALPNYPPWVTFKKKSGVCSDASIFAKYTLNKINPDYKAELVYLDSPDQVDHFVCGFWLDDKLWIMDYGTTSKATRGLHGPFVDLKDYVDNFYTKYHERKNSLRAYYFGWPAGRKETW